MLKNGGLCGGVVSAGWMGASLGDCLPELNSGFNTEKDKRVKGWS